MVREAVFLKITVREERMMAGMAEERQDFIEIAGRGIQLACVEDLDEFRDFKSLEVKMCWQTERVLGRGRRRNVSTIAGECAGIWIESFAINFIEKNILENLHCTSNIARRKC